MRRAKGFTLIELLVVVAIIAVLIAMLLPAIQNARGKARLISCAANFHGLGQGVYVYAGDFNGFAPVSHNYMGNLQHAAWSGGEWHNFGLLYGSRIVENPQALYCPSFQGTLDSDTPSYEAMRGEWKRPPSVDIIRIPYTYMIPHIENEYSPFTGRNDFTYHVPGARGWGFDGIEVNKYKFWTAPIENLGSFTIGSDLLYTYWNWTHAQERGFNTLSGDGSVKFVRFSWAENYASWPGWWSGGTRSLHLFFYAFEKGNL
jgi:prepilin-type N-terminal cleavage/methylation domain-containing protein